MTSKYLTRTSYREAPTGVGLPPFRNGPAALRETGWDVDFYYRPLEQVHSSALHGWGAAEGLRVSATNESTTITVAPGVAIDVVGQHISLGVDGFAEIGVDPQLGANLVEVLAAGVSIPTVGLTGSKYLTIQWWETFDNELYQDSGNAIFRFMHTPWIRLVDAASFPDNGQEIVLARVTLDGANRVVGLSPEKRRGSSLPVQSIELERAVQSGGAPSFSVENRPYGSIRPLSGGGMELSVEQASDDLLIRRNGGGSFARTSIGAEQVVFFRNDSSQTFRFNTDLGNLALGGFGTDGDVQLFDHQQRNTVTLSGYEGIAVLGAEGKAGGVRVKSAGGTNTFEVNGASGDVSFRGALRDPNNAHNGLTHQEIAQLTNGGQNSLHRHDIGVIGWWGGTSTRIGVTSAWVNLSGAHANGDVLIKFADRSTAANGSGFDNVGFWGGFQGNFSQVPHVITSPISVMLSTWSDSFFQFWCSWLSWDEIRLNWTLDGSNKGPAIFEFLAIGPI